MSVNHNRILYLSVTLAFQIFCVFFPTISYQFLPVLAVQDLKTPNTLADMGSCQHLSQNMRQIEGEEKGDRLICMSMCERGIAGINKHCLCLTFLQATHFESLNLSYLYG